MFHLDYQTHVYPQNYKFDFCPKDLSREIITFRGILDWKIICCGEKEDCAKTQKVLTTVIHLEF